MFQKSLENKAGYRVLSTKMKKMKNLLILNVVYYDVVLNLQSVVGYGGFSRIFFSTVVLIFYFLLFVLLFVLSMCTELHEHDIWSGRSLPEWRRLIIWCTNLLMVFYFIFAWYVTYSIRAMITVNRQCYSHAGSLGYLPALNIWTDRSSDIVNSITIRLLGVVQMLKLFFQ